MKSGLSVENISFRYKKDLPWVLKDLTLNISYNERVAIVGDSGCGKSTSARIIAGYLKEELGQVLWKGKDIREYEYSPVQLIFQHPERAVNPRWKMKKILNEGFNVDDELINLLDIKEEWLNRWPNELSLGQLQRFCIGRVLSLKTEFLICDEITTMVDIISQEEIWDVLLKISKEREMGMLVITHNIELAKKVTDRIIRL